MASLISVLKGVGGIIVAILAFGLLIFIHELGHFIAAKRAGVRVNEFSIGMGPAFWKRSKGETLYALRAIPFGGYVAMEGEDEDSEDERSFGRAPLWRRAIILVAGAFMNMVLGVIILAILASTMPMYGSTKVAQFDEDSVSDEWLMVGDEILRMNDKRTRTYNDVIYQLQRSRNGVMDILVLRDGQEVLLKDVTFAMEEAAEDYYMISLDFLFLGEEKSFTGFVREVYDQTIRVTKTVWSGLFDFATGKVGIKQMSGPVGITKEIGKMSSSGNWENVALFVAMISINLGIVNLLPFPALDGGRLLFLFIEAIRGKKMNPNVEMYINGIGLVLLLGLMVVVTFKDIFALF